MIMNRNQIRLLMLLIALRIDICRTINTKLPAVFYGNEGWNMNEIQDFSSWLGKSPVVILLFTDWCNTSMINLFTYQLNYIWNNPSIPVITWELFGCGGSSQPGIIQLVANNTYDTYINQFGDNLKLWLAGTDGIFGNSDDRRAYLRLAHEMNGNWYPWSIGSTPQDYISAWHHIHDIFTNKSVDSTRLQWIWCVNNVDDGSYVAENYWVGDDYVDWMGIDGYNIGTSQSWSSWMNPNQIFDNMIARLQDLSSTKPICINEYASTSAFIGNISNITAKNDWLQQFCTYMNDNQINMASYFNIDKETDWAIFGGMFGDTLWNNYSVYNGYQICFQSNDWIQTNNTNPRLISDVEFSGIVPNTTNMTTTTPTTTVTSTTSSNVTTSGSTTQTKIITTFSAITTTMDTTLASPNVYSNSIAATTLVGCSYLYHKFLAAIICIIMIYRNN